MADKWDSQCWLIHCSNIKRAALGLSSITCIQWIHWRQLSGKRYGHKLKASIMNTINMFAPKYCYNGINEGSKGGNMNKVTRCYENKSFNNVRYFSSKVKILTTIQLLQCIQHHFWKHFSNTFKKYIKTVMMLCSYWPQCTLHQWVHYEEFENSDHLVWLPQSYYAHITTQTILTRIITAFHMNWSLKWKHSVLLM